MNDAKSGALFERAEKCIPGGVNSPVRAFRSVDMTPRFIQRASGSHIWDADGNEYVDYIGSWGPMILGHAHPGVIEKVNEAVSEGLSFGAATEREVEMAELISEIVPSIEMVRMVNSGTEAVMSAIRVARGFTGRNKIIKFEGCYHGHADAMLIKAGSGVMTQGMPGSAGVPEGCTKDTLSAAYNDLQNVRDLFEANPNEIAAVIVEPVGANMGVVLPEEGFLQGLRSICDENGALLIFDEVITGFRLALGGAQEYFGVRPDLTTFGKIIGGGMPVGAYGGRRDVMQVVAPLGAVYQAGTLSGNPVAMAAGLAQLRTLRDTPDFYKKLNEKSDKFFRDIDGVLNEAGVAHCLKHIGSLGAIFFTSENVTDYESAKTSDTEKFRGYFKYMLEHGFYFAPSQFEAIFVSGAHTDEDLSKTVDAIGEFVKAEN